MMPFRLIGYILGTLLVGLAVWMPLTVARLAFHAVAGAFSRPERRDYRG